MMFAGFANQPTPASVPTSPLKRKSNGGEGLCRYCNGVHWGKFCTSEAAIASRHSKPPSRPCSFCTGNHWDIDCKDLASKKPRQTQLDLLYSVLLGLDYLTATDASVRPAQDPFLIFPPNPDPSVLILNPSRIAPLLEINTAVFNASVFIPLDGPGLAI